MSQSDQFWQYAKEAMVSATQTKTEIEKRDLLKLARTWSQAALQSESDIGPKDDPSTKGLMPWVL